MAVEAPARKPLPAPRPAAAGGGRTAGAGTTRAAWGFLTPYLVVFSLFLLLPVLANVGISFTEWKVVGTPEFVGWDNYSRIFADPLFQASLVNTAYFVALSVPPLIVLPLALAMLVNGGRGGAYLVRTLVYLPTVTMVTMVGVLWLWLLDTEFGLVNHYLGLLGVEPVGWLSDSRWAMPAVVVATVWWTSGRNMVIYLAALQGIPEELYEAAKLDGAGRWQRFRYVTLPALGDAHGFVVPFTFIASWQVFGQIYVMTGGGPGRSTVVLTQYVYLTAFQGFQMGPAAAASVVMLLIMFVCTLVVVRRMKVRL